MDLVRELLRWAEDAEPNAERWSDEYDQAYDHLMVAEHIRLMKEAGLVDAVLVEAQGDILKARIDRLTWDGHEFLAGARNDTVWNKAKMIAKEKGLDLTVDLLKALLPKAAAALLGSHGLSPMS